MTQIEGEDVPDLSEKKKKTYKTVLLCVHSLTLILSVVLFICGLVTNLRHLAYHQAWHASYGIYNGSVMSIIAGLVCTIISVIGIAGTAKENYCILLVFCSTLSLVVCLEVVLALSLFTLASKNKLGYIVGQTMMTSLAHFEQSGYDGVTKAWNLVQTELTCCGVNSPADWHQSKSMERPFLPESCCKAVEVSSMCRIDNETFGPYEKGCLEAFSHFLHANAGVIGTLIAIVAFIQIAVILVTVKLIKNTKKPDKCYPFY